MAPNRVTATTSFGSTKRESHDATAFYARFTPPTISADSRIEPPVVVDRIFLGDAARMTDRQVADRSVALLVTSPPYFTGKDYELDVSQGHIPDSYLDYLATLEEVLGVCAEKLEPGGRMAVNVANLGRKPYRSLSADLTHIMADRLGLLMRGEIIWQKAKGAGGSCAWGSFRSPANPVLRDLTERVLIFSKGRFDRAIGRADRRRRRLPAESSISAEQFMEATLDVWDIPAESASRIGHPAPFPIALPLRLIELYTYVDDLVLDPFVGSGTTAVAAVRTGRHYVGFDTEPEYVALAEQRLAAEKP